MPWQRSFRLKEFADFWRVSPISLQGGYAALELQKDFLDLGKKRTFPEWVAYSKAAATQNKFYVGSSAMHYALTDLLHENKDHPKYSCEIESIREFLEKKLSKPLMTLSKTTYRPLPYPDSITHTQGNTRYSKLEHLFGSNGYLHNLWDGDRMCDALFGEEDKDMVTKVNQWISHKDTYLSRGNSKDKTAYEGCVYLVIGKVTFHVGINASISQNYFRALGMCIRGQHNHHF